MAKPIQYYKVKVKIKIKKKKNDDFGGSLSLPGWWSLSPSTDTLHLPALVTSETKEGRSLSCLSGLPSEPMDWVLFLQSLLVLPLPRAPAGRGDADSGSAVSSCSSAPSPSRRAPRAQQAR